MIEFLRGGLLTTIQDKGRIGYQNIGMPVSGVMDFFSMDLINALLGNPEDTEVLEITLLGPKVLFHTDCYFTLSGGIFHTFLDDFKIKNNRVYKAKKGEILEIKDSIFGGRIYLGILGGFKIDKILGSRSTYLRGNIGGLEGRTIKDRDTLHFNNNSQTIKNKKYRFDFGGGLIKYSITPTIRVVCGAQFNLFSKKGIASFLAKKYKITKDCDRMGYRLCGPNISYRDGKDENIISEGITFGSIQVTNGNPIIMGADRQTTGGYGKIASVITADLPLLAQLGQGDTVTFKLISIEEAQNEYLEIKKYISNLRRILNSNICLKKEVYEYLLDDDCFNIGISQLVKPL